MNRNEESSPNLSSRVTTMIGLGKKIGFRREYFDGVHGGSESSFGKAEIYKDEHLESARISSDYYEMLNWRTLYQTVTIRKSTFAGEEVYIVVKAPVKGDTVTDHFSTKSFLLVRRESADAETIYTDYRNVDGEMVPFRWVNQGGVLGRVIVHVQQMKFNTPIPPSTFRPASKWSLG